MSDETSDERGEVIFEAQPEGEADETPEEAAAEVAAGLAHLNGHGGVTPQPVVRRGRRWATYYVDLAWPSPGVSMFPALVKGPALFRRAWMLRERGKVELLTGSPASDTVKIRMLFLMCPDAEPVACQFMAVTQGHAVTVPEESTDPLVPLDAVMSPTGETVMLYQVGGFVDMRTWQMPLVEIGPTGATSPVTPPG